MNDNFEMNVPFEILIYSPKNRIIDDAIDDIDEEVQDYMFHMDSIEEFKSDEETYDAKWEIHHQLYMDTLTEILSKVAIESQKDMIL
jgi:hypothetical protein